MTSKRALDRAERMQATTAGMETDYRAILVGALRDCAAGRPGLFGHNEHIRQGLRARPPVVNELLRLGEEIDRLRRRFGLGPFELAAEFEAARGRPAPEAPGEAKQATEWLNRLGA